MSLERFRQVFGLPFVVFSSMKIYFPGLILDVSITRVSHSKLLVNHQLALSILINKVTWETAIGEKLGVALLTVSDQSKRMSSHFGAIY